MYCTQKAYSKNSFLYENVELLGFDTLQELNEYKIDKEKIVDFSREHIAEIGVEKYFLLVQK